MPYTGQSRVMRLPDDFDSEILINAILPTAVATAIDASSDSVVSITDSAEMEFPQGIFINPDGSLFEGIVNVWLTIWNPRNRADLETVPSDFMISNEGGRQPEVEQGLITGLVFCMGFTDMQGNAVLVREGCKFRVRRDFLPLATVLGPPALWTLAPVTGLWDFNTDMVENGDDFETRVRIFTNIRDINIDWRLDTCYLKVITYQDSNFDTIVSGVPVSAVTLPDINVWGTGPDNAITNGDGVACLRVRCCPDNIPGCNETLQLRAEATAGPLAAPLNGATAGQSGLSNLAVLEYDNNNAAPQPYIRTRIFRDKLPVYTTQAQCMRPDQEHLRFYRFAFAKIFIYGRVTDQDGNGLGNVRILVDGVELARTGDDGTFRVALSGRTDRLVVR